MDGAQEWSWTGLVNIQDKPRTRLAWDWLELLIIPIVLGAAALWFNAQTRKSEQVIAQDRVQEEALQGYLDRMQELILDKGLRTSGKDAEIRNVARTRTLAVLRSLDGKRKGEVVRFLYESGLIGKLLEAEESEEKQVIEAIIDLRTADLSYADLHRANLSGANLRFVILDHADLCFADLSYANLREAMLPGAQLFPAYWRYDTPPLIGRIDLSHADLTDAMLVDADMRNANLMEAKGLNDMKLAQAHSLVGAILPDETVMTKNNWKEIKKSYRF
jgi:uncharacterized protein YjbI with pentapeptide repeats